MSSNAMITVGVIGVGNMGSALIQGLRSAPTIEVWAGVRTEMLAAKVHDELGVSAYVDYAARLAETDVLLLAVKPPVIVTLCKHLAALGTMSPTLLVASVAAGVGTASMEAALGGNKAVVRAMPNTACRVRQGMTVLSRGRWANDFHIEQAGRVFETVGRCLELPETAMSAATAVSASGPAFIYLVMEALRDGGIMAGLTREAATALVTQCVIGSGEMARQSGRHPALLRDEITTPGGCTIAGLLVLEHGATRSTFARAVEEAARVASGLGGK